MSSEAGPPLPLTESWYPLFYSIFYSILKLHYQCKAKCAHFFDWPLLCLYLRPAGWVLRRWWLCWRPHQTLLHVWSACLETWLSDCLSWSVCKWWVWSFIREPNSPSSSSLNREIETRASTLNMMAADGQSVCFLVVLFQTKDVTTAMAEGRFDDAIKLRGTWGPFDLVL